LLVANLENTATSGEVAPGALQAATSTVLYGGLTVEGEVETGPAVLGGPMTNLANGHIYYLLSQNTWSNAEAEAVSLGGHLATVRNEAENAWILRTFSTYGGRARILWIGLSDRDKKFHFAWSSGESVSYAAWEEGEPNNAGGGEDFVAIYFFNYQNERGKWNDFGDRKVSPRGLPMNGVMEIIPQKTTASLESSSDTTLVQQSAASLQAVQIGPSLIITNDGPSIELQWPISASSYALEATADLGEPFKMFGYSELTNTAAGVVSAIITNPGARMYFRLRKP
jgi:hypothetical protein